MRTLNHALIIIRFLFSCFIALYLPASYAQNSGGGIRGVIKTSDNQKAEIAIEINSNPFLYHTDTGGTFIISHLIPGKYSLIISAAGYSTIIREVEVFESTQYFEFTLKAQPEELKEIAVLTKNIQLAPQATTLPEIQLKRDYFDSRVAVNFAQSLEKIAGISSINTGVGIGKPVIRGMSFNRILVNDRGIKQEGQQWGADHGLELDPFDVASVSILKGPASLIYGSDGMGGVINITPPNKLAKDTTNILLSNTYQSVNNLLGTSLSIQSKKGKWQFRGRYTHQNFGDYRIPASNFTYAGFVLPIYDYLLTNTAGRENHFSAQTTYTAKRFETSLTISRYGQEAGLFVGAVGIPNTYNLRHFGEKRDIALPQQSNSHLKIISNTIIRQGDYNHFEIDLAFQRNSREELSLPHAHGYGPDISSNLSLGLYLNTLTANTRYFRKISSKTKSITGIQLQSMNNQFAGFEFLVPRFNSQQIGAFYFLESEINKKMIVTAGVRIDGANHSIAAHEQPIYRNRIFTGEYDLRNPEINRQFNNFSGSIGGQYQIASKNQLLINLGSSFKMPTPIELSMNGVHHGNFRHELGNADLLPERGYQIDVTYRYKGEKITLEVSPFLGYFDSYIYLSPSTRFSPLQGAGAMWEYQQNNAVFTGGEFTNTVQVVKNLSLGTGVEYVWNTNTESGLPLPLTPPLSALFQLEYKNNLPFTKNVSFRFFTDVRLAAAQTRTDRNERETPAYQLVDTGIQIYFKQWKFQLAALNLFNKAYFNHMSRYRLINLPEPGRNISLKINIPII